MQNSKGVNGGICESGTREEGGDPLVVRSRPDVGWAVVGIKWQKMRGHKASQKGYEVQSSLHSPFDMKRNY